MTCQSMIEICLVRVIITAQSMFARPQPAAPMDNRAAAAGARDTSSSTLRSGRKVRRIKLKDVKGKKCWICFTEEGVDDQSIKNNAQWVHPCQCSLVAHKEVSRLDPVCHHLF